MCVFTMNEKIHMNKMRKMVWDSAFCTIIIIITRPQAKIRFWVVHIKMFLETLSIFYDNLCSYIYVYLLRL